MLPKITKVMVMKPVRLSRFKIIGNLDRLDANLFKCVIEVILFTFKIKQHV